MNVVYSSDENYVQHMAVSMLSIFKTHAEVNELRIFVISNGITEESKEKVTALAEKYGRTVEWIDFAPYAEKLVLDMEWPISLSSYARLFMAEMLPQECERALYLDCDTIVCDDLTPFWITDMEEYAVAGVRDLIGSEFKKRIGLLEDDIYINAGILLVNLELWRKWNLQERYMAFILEHSGRVTHHDQGVINGTLQGAIRVVDPKYNAMTPFFTNKYANLINFYGLKGYYKELEIKDAVENPVIIHFVPEFVGRVWEKGCRHPKAHIYHEYLEQTVWKGRLVEAQPLSMKLRLVYWMYHNLPISILKFLLNLRKK